MKKLIIGFAFALVASASQASYLWWELSSTDMTDIGTYAKSQSLGSDDVIAQVVQLDADGKRTGKVSTTGFLDEWYTMQNIGVNMQDVFGDDGTGATFSYYVEVVNASDTSKVLGYNSKAQTYSELATAKNITTDWAPTEAATWHGGSGSMKATPEPTSAMLMLLGVAGLALKRKQKKA